MHGKRVHAIRWADRSAVNLFFTAIAPVFQLLATVAMFNNASLVRGAWHAESSTAVCRCERLES